jgi:hypothetical protein
MKKHLPFVLVMIVCLITASAEAQQNPSNSRVALLIANSNYPDLSAPLATPVKDASSIGEELKRLGFAVDIRNNLSKGDRRVRLHCFSLVDLASSIQSRAILFPRTHKSGPKVTSAGMGPASNLS